MFDSRRLIARVLFGPVLGALNGALVGTLIVAGCGLLIGKPIVGAAIVTLTFFPALIGALMGTAKEF